MRVGIYARVSTIDKGQDPNLQLNDLRAYARARGWDVVKEYVDEGVSGSRDTRPALNELLDDCRKRKVDCILVWRLDRFGRSLKHLINTLDELKSLGVSFISYQENLDFTTSTGQLLFHLLGAFAEFEKNLIRERVRAGLQNARAKGIRVGRRPKITRELSETASDMRARGMSLRTIARSLNVSKSLVHKTLKNSGLQTLEKSSSRNEKSIVF